MSHHKMILHSVESLTFIRDPAQLSNAADNIYSSSCLTLFNLNPSISVPDCSCLKWLLHSHSVNSSFSNHPKMLAFLHTSGSQSVIPRPAAPAWPGNLLEMQISKPRLRHAESKTGGEKRCATHSPSPSLLNATLICFFLSHRKLLKFFPLQSSNPIHQLLTGHLPWLPIRCLPGKEFPPMPYHFCNPSFPNGNTIYPGASPRILGITDSCHIYSPKEPLVCHRSTS